MSSERANTDEAKPVQESTFISIPPIPRFRFRWVWREYAIALLAVLAAVAARFAFDPVFGDQHSFFTFLIAAATIAWYFGLGPTLLAIAAGGAAADYFFVAPRMSFAMDKPGRTGMLLYLSITLFLGFMAQRRKRAEIESNTMKAFKVLADSIPQLVWTAKAEGEVDWFNQRWYDYTGATETQATGWGWQSFHDPDELPKVLEQWCSSLRTGVSFEMRYSLRAKDSSFRPFLARVVPVRDAHGMVTRWFGTATDVAEYDAGHRQ